MVLFSITYSLYEKDTGSCESTEWSKWRGLDLDVMPVMSRTNLFRLVCVIFYKHPVDYHQHR